MLAAQGIAPPSTGYPIMTSDTRTPGPPSPTAVMTVSGRYFDPMQPRIGDVDLGDIAHAMSWINRFNGHTTRPITVGEHSLRVERIAWRMPRSTVQSYEHRFLVRLLSRLHDASEAYIGDIVSPMKTDAMRAIEGNVMHTILAAVAPFVLTINEDEVEAAWRIVRQADALAFYFEAMLWQPGAHDLVPRVLESIGIAPAAVPAFLPDIWPRPGEDWKRETTEAIRQVEAAYQRSWKP